MATPIRKKRNFKALQLQPTPNPSVTMTSDPPLVLPTKTTTGKKRPPPMTLKAPKVATTSRDQDGNMLTVSNDLPSSAPPTASASKTYHSALSEKLANFGEDLKNEDLKDIQELGQGNGGSVKKVEHTPTGTIMAKKVYPFLVLTTPVSHEPPRSFCPRSTINARNSQSPIVLSSGVNHMCTDRIDRRKTVGEEADSAGAADHARLQFAIHHFLLRRVHLGSQYLHLHGVYGQGIIGRDLQADWTYRHRRRGESRVGRVGGSDVFVRCPSDHSPW